MKQVLQDLRTGETYIAEVPSPSLRAGHVLIRSVYTLVSPGTERMLLKFGKANLLAKARQQPEKVRLVLEKAKTDGILATLDAVRRKLDEPIPLGYCNVGVVIDVASDVDGFSVGDRVVSNGSHAEVVAVPKNLCAKVPPGVPDEIAVFTVLGAIGLQGIRLIQPTLGETIVVVGLGTIGLLTAKLLRAHGCRVLGIDLDFSRVEKARSIGIPAFNGGDGVVGAVREFSRGQGADGVVITASTDSSEPVRQAASMCRKRGRIVLVGVAGLELSRTDFYEKELTFQVSCSYGPGRYDKNYEQKGNDYPIGYVRWTEQRNFEAVLDMMAEGRIDPRPLISHVFDIADAQKAYQVLSNDHASLGILLRYSSLDVTPHEQLSRRTVVLRNAARKTSDVVAGFLGAGNYATAELIPAFQHAGVRLKTIASHGGTSSAIAARKFGFERATTALEEVLDDDEINLVVIATRHDSHAELVCRSLRQGKHTFVEKPLALTIEELSMIQHEYEQASKELPNPLLMVGFNRRFAPHIRKMKELLGTVYEPKAFLVTVNAGAMPSDHWTQDKAIGGGRILGEGCHFIDLLRHLSGSRITRAQVCAMRERSGIAAAEDKAIITLEFQDGSIGAIHYLANGHKAFPKERLEIFVGGRILQLDNYRTLHGYGWAANVGMRLWRQDKGHKACVASFVRSLREGADSPIAFEEIVETSRTSIEISGQLQ